MKDRDSVLSCLKLSFGFLMATIVVSLSGSAIQAYPFSGYDKFPTTADVDIYDPADNTILLESITLTGDAVVFRSDPFDPGDGRIKIDTRLDTLLLRGFSLVFADSIFITLNRDTASLGCVQQVTAGVDFPAESFFDVFYRITLGSAPDPPVGPGGSFDGALLSGKFAYDLKNQIGRAVFEENLKSLSRLNPDAIARSKPSSTPLSGSVGRIYPDGEAPLGSSAALCDGEWHGAAAFVLSQWYTGQEIYYEYQDPIETGCVDTYPFEVTQVNWFVTNLSPDTELTVEMQPMIFEVDLSDPNCPKPGVLLCAGQLFSVTLPPNFQGVVGLPITCCVKGPYFAAVDCPVLIGTGFMGIITDDAAAAPGARTCANYNDWGAGLRDLIVDQNFPGNVKLWTEGLSSDMNTCGTVSFINLDPPRMSDTIWQLNPGPLGREYKDPRKIPIIDPVTGETIAWIFHVHKVDPPPPDVDTLITWGIMDVWLGPDPPQPSQQPDEAIMVEGPTVLQWGEITDDGEGLRQVQTEILSMDLTGNSELFGPVILRLPFPAPGGARSVSPAELYPMESFFDVFYQINFPQLGQTIEPIQPPQMQALIEAIPPAYDAQYEDPAGPHPVHDIQNPGVVIGWVRPIHIVHPPTPADSGACCADDGSCRVTSEAACLAAGDDYQGDGTNCNPNPCPQPPKEDWFESIGQATLTFDPADDACQAGVTIDLTSVFSSATVVEVDPPPYTTGTVIQTEIVQLELTGSDPVLGDIIVRNRTDVPSLGSVTNVVADGSGNFQSGDSEFDVFLEIEVVTTGQKFNTELVALHLEAPGITALPPLGADYFPPPTDPPIQMFNINNPGVLAGWLCHGLHRPTIQVPCDLPPGERPTGACCLPDNSCVETSEGECALLQGYYYGDNTLCSDPNVVCPPERDQDCLISVGGGSISLDPGDPQCGIAPSLSLSSGFETADILVDPGPYVVDQVIQTEIVAMSLTGTDPILGTVNITERTDKASSGKIENVNTDGLGNLTAGDSYFDVYVQVELPDVGGGLTLNTGNIPFRLEARISSLPPLDSVYFPPPSAAPLRLFDVATGLHVGWFCHAEHKPTIEIDWTNIGACCLGDGTCVQTDANFCQLSGGVFQGAGVPCTPDLCGAATGACCLLDGGCAQTDPLQCDGYFQGVGTPCDQERCCCELPGDANHDGKFNIADVTFLIARIFAGGEAPFCCAEADCNADGRVNIADVTFKIARIFAGGPPAKCGPPTNNCK